MNRIYQVNAGQLYYSSQWQYLYQAFDKHPEFLAIYTVDMWKMTEAVKRFCIRRKDGKAVLKAEREKLGWFFQGVLLTPAFPKD